MHGKGKYKFKVINGVLSWKNEEMERFMPVSPEILTRVILLYEKQLKTGISIWKEISEIENQGLSVNLKDDVFLELASWMEQLQEIFANTDPFREKGKWLEGPVHLN